MSEQTREEALAHFGKKGMKWGVKTETKGSSEGSGPAGAKTGGTKGSSGAKPAVKGEKKKGSGLRIAGATTAILGASIARAILHEHSTSRLADLLSQEHFPPNYLHVDPPPQLVV